MKNSEDAYGQHLLAQYFSRTPTVEIIERDDNYIDTGSEPGQYYTDHKHWSAVERRAVGYAKGRVLDIGCGAGRHAIYLQEQGFDVTGIDNSPGAIKACKLRGLKKAIVRPIADIDKFKPNSFETILMLGNNFGLFGSAEGLKTTLAKMHHITTPDAQIIAGSLNPYHTSNPTHLDYHKANKKQGRMPGQIRLRVRYGKAIGEWFDYLFVSPEEMKFLVDATDWRIEKLIVPSKTWYAAIIKKRLES